MYSASQLLKEFSHRQCCRLSLDQLLQDLRVQRVAAFLYGNVTLQRIFFLNFHMSETRRAFFMKLVQFT